MDKLKLRGRTFSPAFGASGVQGLFDETREYKYKKYYEFIPGYSFDGMTFVAKTFTYNPHKGYTELGKNGYSIKRFFPSSIKVYPFDGAVLNAVGLSNPGLAVLANYGKWQKRKDNFFLSYMPVGKTKEERIDETVKTKWMLERATESILPRIGLQVNYSCPNTEHGQLELIDEIETHLEILNELGIPLVPKFNITLSPLIAKRILDHPLVDAICVSNTVPWGMFPDQIDWNRFGKNGVSPLAKFNGGGLSGSPIFPLICSWLEELNKLQPTKPVIACGGVMSIYDFYRLRDIACVDGVSIGSVAMLRPWRVQEIIDEILDV